MSLTDKDVDATMAADWAAIQEKYAVKDEPEKLEPITAEAETVEPETDETENVKRETSNVDSTKERQRDESGKFIKSQEKEKPVKPDTTQINNDASTQQDELPQRDINRPPSTWKPVVRGEWDKLTPSVRAEIHRREADFQNGQAQLLPDARLGSAIKQATAPYQMLIESNYGTPDRAMQAFLQTAAALQMGSPQQKLQTIVGLSQQFGIDLSPLLQQGQPQQQQPQQQFRDARVDQIIANEQRREQQRQQQELQQLSGIADSWVAEQDASGNPLRPYVGDVINEMTVLIPQIKQANPHFSHAQVLEQAYDRAVWANPDTRAALQGQRQSELQAKQLAENQNRVASAKRAASVNVPRRASIPSPAKPGTMDETIRNTARELGLIT